MRLPIKFLSLACLVACLAGIQADPAPALAPAFEVFKPLLGKTWRGRFGKETEAKPVYDVMKWERILNGQAVRVMHAIDHGVYGGETIITVDPKTKGLEFHYFTTTGMKTRGTMTVTGGKIVSHEDVVGSSEGITEVKGTTEILPDGRIHVKSRYLKKGEWVDGHEIIYKEDPTAEVVFK
jgi:hypothetical protein